MKKVEYNDVNLEWYVLNGCYSRPDNKFEELDHYFHQTNVRPWNVFSNWTFKKAAFDLVKGYYEGKMKNWDWCNDFPKDGTDYEKFKFNLMHELMHEQWARTEYEICVAEWPPTYLNKDGERISVYAGQEHEPIEDVEMDKIDTYMQVVPNKEIFCQYVFDTVSKAIGRHNRYE